jgi:hypothetical protein
VVEFDFTRLDSGRVRYEVNKCRALIRYKQLKVIGLLYLANKIL